MFLSIQDMVVSGYQPYKRAAGCPKLAIMVGYITERHTHSLIYNEDGNKKTWALKQVKSPRNNNSRIFVSVFHLMPTTFVILNYIIYKFSAVVENNISLRSAATMTTCNEKRIMTFAKKIIQNMKLSRNISGHKYSSSETLTQT